MSNQLQITGGAKVRALDGVITGTSGVLSSVPYGGANGVATLDSAGKIPVSQLPNSVMEYKGTWNVATNTPYLVNGTGNAGDVYMVTGAAVGGTNHDFGAGNILFYNGDQAIYDGSAWQRASGSSGTVTSVALSAPSAFNVTGSPITTSGTLTITGAGTTSQYINGTGGLTTFPSLTGFVPYTGATNDLNLGTHNLYANNLFDGFTNVAASGTQIVLTIASTPSYTITGSGGQTIKLPDATTLPNGAIFSFNNNQSSGAITINNNSNTLVVSVPSGGFAEVVLLDNSIAAGSWDRHFKAPSNVSWSTNTLDYAGSITSATWNGNVVAINRGGTGSSTQNFVDLTTNQTIGGAKTFSSFDTKFNQGFFSDYAIKLKKDGSISLLNGYVSIGEISGSGTSKIVFGDGNSSFSNSFLFNTSSDKTYTFPNASGTLALTSNLSSYVPTLRQLTINGTAYDLSADRTWSVGTVTSVAALTLGTTGTDVSSSVANSTTTPVITLNVPTASATNRGALSSSDWTTFNSKESALTFSSPLVRTTNTISIPAATTSVNGYLTSTDWTTFNSKANALSGTINTIAYWNSSTTISSLALLTYPSLTELSYVKGVTSAIQTQLDAKQIALNGTGFVKASGTTISYDNSTYLTTASAASTYQTILTNPVTGTGTSGQVAYFNGTTSLTSSATFAFTPTSQLLINNSVTAASAIARGTYLTPTLVAAANGDVLVGLDISPTFTNGAFTGVINLGLRYTGLGNTSAAGSLNYSGLININTTQRTVFGMNDNSLNVVGAYMQFFGNNYATIGQRGSAEFIFDNRNSATAGFTIFESDNNTWTNRFKVYVGGNITIGLSTNAGYRLDVNGTTRISGVLTLSSTISNGTYTYTLPSATGTLALTSAIPANPVGGTGTTNYLPKFTGTSTIGNSLIWDNGTNVGIGNTNTSYTLDVTGTGRFSTSLTVGAGGLTGRLSVRGTTNDSSAYAFEAANSSGATLFAVRNDGASSFSSSVTANGNISTSYAKMYNSGDIDINSNNGSSQLNFYNSGTALGSIGKGNYAVSGGDSTGISIYSQGAMSFATGGQTERMRITSGGIINTTSRLNVNGSGDNSLFSLNSGGTLYTTGFSPNAQASSSNTLTLTSAGTVWIYNGTGVATWTLFNPSGTNQMVWIKNAGTGIITLNAYSGTNIINNAGSSVSSITIAVGATALIQQDGNVKSYQLQ